MRRSRARPAILAGLVALATVFTAAAGVIAIGRANASTSIQIVIRYSHFEPSSITVPVGEDIVSEEEAFFLPEKTYLIRPRTTIILVAR